MTMKPLAWLFDLFLERRCPLCDRPTSAVVCPHCQRRLESCQLAHPAALWQGELPVFSWGQYGGPLKRAIAALKYDNQPILASVLGQWLGQVWVESAPIQLRRCQVVPIPMHPEKQAKRGYNQADLLAEPFCRATGFTLKTRGLRRIKATQAQFSLSGAEREANLADAFQVVPQELQRRTPSPILLLDDIYTTGATARSAATALQQAGLVVNGIVTLACAAQNP